VSAYRGHNECWMEARFRKCHAYARTLPNGEGHIQNLLSVYIGMDIFNFFPTFSKEKLGSDFKGNQGVNFKFDPNMFTIYSDQ